MDIKIITAIVGSSVLSAIITSLFTKSSKDKSDKLQYITNERKQWRDDIRKAAVEVRKISNNEQAEKMFKTIQEAKTYFQVRLNPEDTEDNKLLECFNIENNKMADDFDEFVARLLKHDWERVKKETGRSFLKIYYIMVGFTVLLFLLYLITEWLGGRVPKENILVLSFQTVLTEIVHYKTLLFLTLFPVFIYAVNGIWIFFLKKMKLSIIHKCKKAAVCSWLKIPYRGIILNSNEKNDNKQEAQNG